MMEVYVTENALTIEKVMRTWKERLFTRPWKPLKRFNEIKKPGCFQMGDKLIIHPVIYEQIKKEIDAQKWQFTPRLMMGIGFRLPNINDNFFINTGA